MRFWRMRQFILKVAEVSIGAITYIAFIEKYKAIFEKICLHGLCYYNNVIK